MPVKRLFLFFAFVAIVLASYGLVRENRVVKHPPRDHLATLNFYDKSGKQVTLDDFKGKIVLVDLWATWCVPCVIELPSLDRLQKALPTDKFEVIAISLDTSSMQDIQSFLKEKNIQNLQAYWDKDRQVPLKWKYAGIPKNFILDKEGGIISAFDGDYVWDRDVTIKQIRDLF